MATARDGASVWRTQAPGGAGLARPSRASHVAGLSRPRRAPQLRRGVLRLRLRPQPALVPIARRAPARMSAPAEPHDARAPDSAASPRRVLTIQSHCVRGYVGNKAAVFPLQLLGA